MLTKSLTMTDRPTLLIMRTEMELMSLDSTGKGRFVNDVIQSSVEGDWLYGLFQMIHLSNWVFFSKLREIKDYQKRING